MVLIETVSECDGSFVPRPDSGAQIVVLEGVRTVMVGV